VAVDRRVVEGRPRVVVRLGAVEQSPHRAPSVTAPSCRTAPLLAEVEATGSRTTAPYVAVDLISLDTADEFDLADLDRLTVGRADGSGLRLDDPVVSSCHAELARRGQQWVLRDLGSLNGTWLNGRRIEEVGLVHNDEVSFGFGGPRFVFSRLSPS
jgi:hypothetical protein